MTNVKPTFYDPLHPRFVAGNPHPYPRPQGRGTFLGAVFRGEGPEKPRR